MRASPGDAPSYAVAPAHKNLHSALKASADLCLLVAAAALLVSRPFSVTAIGAAMLVGILQNTWFEAMHWAVHRSLFTSKTVNAWFGHVCGFLSFMPYQAYRTPHLDHHRFLGDPERDPERSGGTTLIYPTAGARIGNLARTVMQLFAFRCRSLIKLALAPSEVHRASAMPYITPDVYRRLVVECRVFLLGYAAVATSIAVVFSPLVICYWPIALSAQLCLMLLFSVPEHAGLYERGSLANKPRARQNAQLAMTRLFTSNFVVRYLRWNENYHAAHHAYPSANYRALPTLARALGDRVPNRYSSYLGFLWFGDRARHGDAGAHAPTALADQARS